MKPESTPIEVGDIVRVRGTPATLAAEVAGLIGQVTRIAQPPGANEVIGQPVDGNACEVFFDELKASYWLPAPLLVVETRDSIATAKAAVSESPSREKPETLSQAHRSSPSTLLGRLQNFLKRVFGVF